MNLGVWEEEESNQLIHIALNKIKISYQIMYKKQLLVAALIFSMMWNINYISTSAEGGGGAIFVEGSSSSLSPNQPFTLTWSHDSVSSVNVTAVNAENADLRETLMTNARGSPLSLVVTDRVISESLLAWVNIDIHVTDATNASNTGVLAGITVKDNPLTGLYEPKEPLNLYERNKITWSGDLYGSLLNQSVNFHYLSGANISTVKPIYLDLNSIIFTPPGVMPGSYYISFHGVDGEGAAYSYWQLVELQLNEGFEVSSGSPGLPDRDMFLAGSEVEFRLYLNESQDTISWTLYKLGGVQSNPLYEEKASGENPLYQEVGGLQLDLEPHYTTFGGNKYDFSEPGSYLMVFGNGPIGHHDIIIHKRPGRAQAPQWDSVIDEQMEQISENPLFVQGIILDDELDKVDGKVCGETSHFTLDAHGNEVEALLYVAEPSAFDPQGNVVNPDAMKLVDTKIVNQEDDGCAVWSFDRQVFEEASPDLKDRFVVITQDYYNVSTFGLTAFQFVQNNLDFPSFTVKQVGENATHVTYAIDNGKAPLPSHVIVGAADSTRIAHDGPIEWFEEMVSSRLQADGTGHVTVLKIAAGGPLFCNCTALVMMSATDFNDYGWTGGNVSSPSFEIKPIRLEVRGVATTSIQLYDEVTISWEPNNSSTYTVQIKDRTGDLQEELKTASGNGTFTWKVERIELGIVQIDVLGDGRLIASGVADINGDGALDIVVATDRIAITETGDISIPMTISRPIADSTVYTAIVELKFYNDSSSDYITIGLTDSFVFGEESNRIVKLRQVQSLSNFEFFDVRVEVEELPGISGEATRLNAGFVITLNGNRLADGDNSVTDDLPLSFFVGLLALIAVPALIRRRY